MAKVRSGIIVTALTTAALGVIGVLAWQASAAPDHAGRPRASATSHHSTGPSAAEKARQAMLLPAGSGTGQRVVYALARHRVWLVDATGNAVRTFEVVPGTVAPAPGAYAVTSHSPGIKGTDGVLVDDIVYFTVVQGTPIAFDYAADGSLPTPDPAKKTGGIREHIADGKAIWRSAPIGAKVVVVP